MGTSNAFIGELSTFPTIKTFNSSSVMCNKYPYSSRLEINSNHGYYSNKCSTCTVPEQTLGGIPLGLGMVMKINFLNFHVHVCTV